MVLLTQLPKSINESFLHDISNMFSHPWIVIGDFDFILNHVDNGGIVTSQTLLDIENQLSNYNSLFSPPYIGNPYTLTNKKHDHAHIL